MAENVLARLMKALGNGGVRVVDLSQPLDAATPVIHSHRSLAIVALPPRRASPSTIAVGRRGIGTTSRAASTPGRISTLRSTGSPAETIRTTRRIRSCGALFRAGLRHRCVAKKQRPIPISC